MAADAAYRYRPLNGGADVDTRGFLAQCDRAFLVGKAAKMGLVAITTTPAFTVVAPNKLALITALGQQPAVATIPVDAMVQHYAGGIYSTNTCAGACRCRCRRGGYLPLSCRRHHASCPDALLQLPPLNLPPSPPS